MTSAFTQHLNQSPVHHLRFRPEKAFAALRQMLAWAQQDGWGPLDLQTMFMACYIADKRHLNEHGRPVFGATYRAMPYGPVPLEIYEMAKGEPLWLAEISRSDYPWHLEGDRIIATGNEPLDTRSLSPSERKALQDAFARARTFIFNERTADSHDTAWRRARHSCMDYADMVDEDNPDREAILDALYDDGHFWRI
jgi:hypothetical protein